LPAAAFALKAGPGAWKVGFDRYWVIWDLALAMPAEVLVADAELVEFVPEALLELDEEHAAAAVAVASASAIRYTSLQRRAAPDRETLGMWTSD
jgi:hypothetical protein